MKTTKEKAQDIKDNLELPDLRELTASALANVLHHSLSVLYKMEELDKELEYLAKFFNSKVSERVLNSKLVLQITNLIDDIVFMDDGTAVSIALRVAKANSEVEPNNQKFKYVLEALGDIEYQQGDDY